MTPQEHIDAAEASLNDVRQYNGSWTEREELVNLLTAIAHALIAAAVEGGVPHAPTTASTS